MHTNEGLIVGCGEGGTGDKTKRLWGKNPDSFVSLPSLLNALLVIADVEKIPLEMLNARG